MKNSPIIFALSSSSPTSSIYCSARGSGEFFFSTTEGHSSECLLSFLDLFPSDFSFAKVDLIAVDIGPGGFTSTRVAVSLSSAFSLSYNLPICPVLSTEALAMRGFAEKGEGLFAVSLSLRKDQNFSALYKISETTFEVMLVPQLFSDDDFICWKKSLSSSTFLLGSAFSRLFPTQDIILLFDAHDVCHYALRCVDRHADFLSAETIRAEYAIMPAVLTLEEQKKLRNAAK